MGIVRRIYVEKKDGFDIEARILFTDIKENLGISNLNRLRLINRYDIEGISESDYETSKWSIFAEHPVDMLYEEEIDMNYSDNLFVFAVEYLPGQYDQRADSAAQCVEILSGVRPIVKTARLIILEGCISKNEFIKIKNYIINPLECREASLKKPEKLHEETVVADDVEKVCGFISMNEDEIKKLHENMEFAMSLEDLKILQSYFMEERRDPTITELKVVDTYWSDHCRHTTFLTEFKNIQFENDANGYKEIVQKAYDKYKEAREYVYQEKKKPECLMDIATIGAKELRKKGFLNDLDVSDEINAASIEVEAVIDGKTEKWLVMFKNETHNHPTEIEPFGGAATCLGGAIRDPLSGRVYVYQAMRVTGSGDPRTKVEDTLPGKLPQRKITTVAAKGYSSYGNQIGLATGQVAEIYDEGYVAKRLEIGAVIGAAPKEHVVRKKLVPSDVVILLGGRTGRDGCGGATGSSKEHNEESLEKCGAEVQKGNPPTERKIQRLFRRREVSTLIKKCNDFGAGGVSVAIGELADGVKVNLDAVPKKYEGLDGTELAISESQERMAVVVSKDDVGKFIRFAMEENLEAVPVAEITEEPRLVMTWRGKVIVDISREFLNTNGVKQYSDIVVAMPDGTLEKVLEEGLDNASENIKDLWLNKISELNICSKKGLVEMFDSTIGAGTVIMPFGGVYQLSPAEGMAAKLPVLKGETSTATVMTYGYNPRISKFSPFHGAVYAVVESLAKICAMGADYKKVRLTLQEYFEKLGKDPKKWGKPFSALLGAYFAQYMLKAPAIGGKDSMSGTFKDMNVPPTLVSFAVTVENAENIISTEFKKEGSIVLYLPIFRDKYGLPDFEKLDKTYSRLYELSYCKKILSMAVVGEGGIASAVSKMSFGNMIGFKFSKNLSAIELFRTDIGSLVVEVAEDNDIEKIFGGIDYEVLGTTIDEKSIFVNNQKISLDIILEKWTGTLEGIFPSKTRNYEDKVFNYNGCSEPAIKSSFKFAKPRVVIPVFPGTNCEYDTQRVFEKAGAIVESFVFKNIKPELIQESVESLVKLIKNAQIIMIPGGFSQGDEPDGSGKFIATVFRNPMIKEEVMRLIKVRDGLILGICNGFQALIKLGLVPYGEITDVEEYSPTLTYNSIGRHVSCIVRTKVVSRLSPWFLKCSLGEIHSIPVSHGEGRFVAKPEILKSLADNGQIATQYVDFEGRPSNIMPFNPNGSCGAVEGITSPDGRILGKMGHSERIGENVYKNVPGNKDQKLFESGVYYFS